MFQSILFSPRLTKMKKIRWSFIVPVFVIITTTCNKDEDSPKPVNALPEPTPVGTEIGTNSIKTIGPEGGTISSYDGKLDVEFPVGALSSVTDISVQTVTNHAPGGRGNAYRIGPSGTQLNMPVTMRYHYTDDDISGSLPMFLGMAVQDTNQIWYNLGNPVLDTLNKTIIVKSKKLFAPASKSARNKGAMASNFMDHATFLDLYIIPTDAELRVSESRQFKVFAVENHSSSEDGSADEDDLPPLPVAHEVSPATVRQWSLNGSPNPNPEYGSISPYGTTCTYTAPERRPTRNPVDLTADIKLWYHDQATGRDFNNLKITAPITIVDDNYSFHLKLSYKKENWPEAMFFNWTVTDMAIMHINVNNGFVTVTNIQNEGEMVTPDSQSYPWGDGSCTATWQGGANGYLNITNARGETGSYGYETGLRTLYITLNNSNTNNPKFYMECPVTSDPNFGGIKILDHELNFTFILKDSTQTANDPDPYLTVMLEAQ